MRPVESMCVCVCGVGRVKQGGLKTVGTEQDGQSLSTQLCSVLASKGPTPHTAGAEHSRQSSPVDPKTKHSDCSPAPPHHSWACVHTGRQRGHE